MADRPENAQRAAKRRRAKLEERKSLATKIALGVAVVLALAATAYGFSLIPERPKNVHWHPTWEVYVNDENVRWASREFDMSNMGSGMHFHQPNDNVVHAETRSDRLILGGLIERLGGSLSDERLVVPTPATPSGEYVSSDRQPLRVFIQPAGEEWREIEDDFRSVVLADKARILVTFAPSSDEALAAQQASVQSPDGAIATTPISNGTPSS